MNCIVGVDVGKSNAKFVSQYGWYSHPSRLYQYRELKLENEFGQKDYIVEFEGKKYLAGELGQKDGELPIFHSGMSKVHKETLINILIYLSRLNQEMFNLIVGCPIEIRTKEEKEKLINLIKGKHEIIINNEQHTINISDVKVAPEGAGAFWSEPRDGIIRGLDFGSTTINYFTVINKEYIDKQSGTFDFGFENIKTFNLEGMAESIASHLENKWKKDDIVMLCGGGAKQIHSYIIKHFPNCYISKNPIFANAIGFYKIGVSVYEQNDC